MSVATLTTEAGGQIRVEDGVGTLVKVDRREGARNARVEIDADHLREPVVGWADLHDDQLAAALNAALDGGGKVGYRIEVRAKDRSSTDPLDRLGNRDKIRELVGLYPPDGVPPTDRPLGDAPSRPVSGPTSPPAGRQPEPRGDTPTPAPRRADSPTGRRPLATEGKPWEAHNSDGRPNLGSYAVTGTLSALRLAQALILERAAAGDDVARTLKPDVRTIRALGHQLLDATDRVQVAVDGGRRDRMAKSHEAARRAVGTALHVHPVPFGATPADRAAWKDALVDHAAGLLRVALELNGETPAADPSDDAGDGDDDPAPARAGNEPGPWARATAGMAGHERRAREDLGARYTAAATAVPAVAEAVPLPGSKVDTFAGWPLEELEQLVWTAEGVAFGAAVKGADAEARRSELASGYVAARRSGVAGVDQAAPLPDDGPWWRTFALGDLEQLERVVADAKAQADVPF